MPTTTPRREASVPRLLRARTAASRGVLASILAAIVVASILVCGLSAVAQLQLRAAVRAAVPAPDAPEGWLQLQTRPADDAGAQDAAASALFADVLGDTAVVERLEIGEPGSDLERVAWRVTPDVDTLGPDTIELLSSGLDRLPDAFRESDAAERGAAVSGALPAAVSEVATGARAATALLPVPLIVLGVLAWFAVLQLARLLGLSRGREAALLRARGQSAAQSTVLAAGESTIVALAGVTLGWAVTLAVVPALPGGAGGFAAAVATWPLALVAVAVAAATLAVGQLRAARRAMGAEAAAGRVARAATPAAGVLLVVVAGVLVWQARTAGSGTWGAVVTTLAPALGVAAVALLSVLLFGPVAALVAALAARWRGVSPSYPARQVARRVSAYSVAVALVAIAVCGAALAGGYAGMASTTAVDSQRVQAGAPLRSVLPVGTGDAALAEGVAGVRLAAPALVVPVAAGDEEGLLVALPSAPIPDLLFDVAGAASPEALAETLASESDLVPIPDAELRLQASVRTSVPQAIGDTAVRAWIADDHGTTVELPLDVEVAGSAASTFAARAALPEGEWSLAAVELARGNAWTQVELSFTGFALTTADGTPLDVTLPPVVRLYGGFGAPGISSALVWSAAGEAADRVPMAITSALASALGLAVGDPVDLAFSSSGRVAAGVVASVSDAIPGIGARPGALADLETLTVAQLPAAPTVGEPAATPPLPDQLWAAGDEASAPALAEAIGSPVLVPGSQSTAVTAPVAIVWIASALGGAVLAGVALVALLTAVTRQRAGEVLVLRAIGIPPRRQARQRIAEAVVVVAIAAVLGAVGGWALTALLVPGLVARAIPSAQLTPSLAIDPWPVVGAVLLIAAGCLAGALGIAASLRAQSRSTRLEEAAP